MQSHKKDTVTLPEASTLSLPLLSADAASTVASRGVAST
jgi:hypothetical protein